METKLVPIPGLPDKYRAGDDGRIYSNSLRMRTIHGAEWNALEPQRNNQGYFTSRLTTDGKSKTYTIHVLICTAFHGERPSPDHLVRHKDRNQQNNSPANLEWAPRSEVRKHGGCVTLRKVKREYSIWQGIKARCLNPRSQGWKYYGARGITVCDRWRDSFEAFYADMGPKPPKHSIDRLNNDGNYEPGNCAWRTVAEQNRNKRKPVRRALLTRQPK